MTIQEDDNERKTTIKEVDDKRKMMIQKDHIKKDDETKRMKS